MVRCVVFACALAAAGCGDSDGSRGTCPGGATPGHGSDLVCGACTRVHEEATSGECPTGYFCTCGLECVWFPGGFPIDAGPGACGLDAAIP
jgi:hypothetical protein